MTVTIDARFCGPPESAHGGYVSGLLAVALGVTAEVTLRAPPPLERALEIVRANGGLVLRDGEKTIAEARAVELQLDVPAPVNVADAEEASKGYPLRENSPFPGCFTCGIAREDGLRIFPGPARGRDAVAAPWTPDASLPNEGSIVRPEIVWAALDCPSLFGTGFYGQQGAIALLGRMTATLFGDVCVDERYVVIGWSLGGEGRRLFGASALFDEEGALVAAARAVWVRLTEAPLP